MCTFPKWKWWKNKGDVYSDLKENIHTCTRTHAHTKVIPIVKSRIDRWNKKKTNDETNDHSIAIPTESGMEWPWMGETNRLIII